MTFACHGQFGVIHVLLMISIVSGVCALRNKHDHRLALSKVINELSLLNQQLILAQGGSARNEPDVADESEDEWVVEVEGGLQDAQWVASLTGSKLVGKMRGFEHMYVMQNVKSSPQTGSVFSTLKRSKRNINQEGIAQLLRGLKQVSFVERQQHLRRQKRYALRSVPKNSLPYSKFNDPLFVDQWQLHESYSDSNDYLDYQPIRTDHQISDVWQLGYSGKGVVVTIIDDGIDYTHSDLAPNYDPDASYDLNDNDADPMPTMNEENSHGTRCAGEVAMVANNAKCGVGVAFNAKIGGIRILDGKLNDRMEAEAFALGLGHVDIMSVSWGPRDDGKTAEKPGRLSQMALEKGIRHGRNGLGTIYVWASGNGGLAGDNCGADGYASSVYSFTVSSAASDGSVPWYAESCPSTLVSTYSSGYLNHKAVVTTNLGNTCTKNHTGTSAATPIAVGIIALGLEANPNLTWRDVQHIAVWTSDPGPTLVQTGDQWKMNAAGLLFHPHLGFGLMNALEFVMAAKKWQTVPEQSVCVTEYADFHAKSFTNSTNGIVKFETSGCRGEDNDVRFIEHVQLVLDIHADFRGHVDLWLESPEGTKSQLLGPRPLDTAGEGFNVWPFTTVHMWGENPRGVWTLRVNNANPTYSLNSNIHIQSIKLVIYGTSHAPMHYAEPRIYAKLPSVNLSRLRPIIDYDNEDTAPQDYEAKQNQVMSELLKTAAKFDDHINPYPYTLK